MYSAGRWWFTTSVTTPQTPTEADTDFMGVPRDLPLWRKNLLAVVLIVAFLALAARFGLWTALAH